MRQQYDVVWYHCPVEHHGASLHQAIVSYVTRVSDRVFFHRYIVADPRWIQIMGNVYGRVRPNGKVVPN
jgi:hypothetical protein